MKRMNRITTYTAFTIALVALLLTGCAGQAAGNPTSPASAAPTRTAQAAPTATAAAPSEQATAAAGTGPAATDAQVPAIPGQKTFTAAELAKYNGKNGSPAYIAMAGVVYDVSNVREWKSGTHKGYSAGKDYTGEFPHGASMLDKVPVVGKYIG